VGLTRRHGAELEEALLTAVWQLLSEEGYAGLTYEKVAARAGTSKPVLYRRWPTKPDLVLAAMTKHGLFQRREAPDTGTLRGDIIRSLEDFNETRADYIALISVFIADISSETGLSPAELRDRTVSDRVLPARLFLERAVARGEIPSRKWPPGVVSLPFDLFRNDLTTTLKRVPQQRLLEIVDEIWLPLVERPLK
jgi:AcrR family transcriptional regulator